MFQGFCRSAAKLGPPRGWNGKFGTFSLSACHGYNLSKLRCRSTVRPFHCTRRRSVHFNHAAPSQGMMGNAIQDPDDKKNGEGVQELSSTNTSISPGLPSSSLSELEVESAVVHPSAPSLDEEMSQTINPITGKSTFNLYIYRACTCQIHKMIYCCNFHVDLFLCFVCSNHAVWPGSDGNRDNVIVLYNVDKTFYIRMRTRQVVHIVKSQIWSAGIFYTLTLVSFWKPLLFAACTYGTLSNVLKFIGLVFETCRIVAVWPKDANEKEFCDDEAVLSGSEEQAMTDHCEIDASESEYFPSHYEVHKVGFFKIQPHMQIVQASNIQNLMNPQSPLLKAGFSGMDVARERTKASRRTKDPLMSIAMVFDGKPSLLFPAWITHLDAFNQMIKLGLDNGAGHHHASKSPQGEVEK